MAGRVPLRQRGRWRRRQPGERAEQRRPPRLHPPHRCRRAVRRTSLLRAQGHPFSGVPGVRDKIWAYGFRNPWRISFDPTGRLWAADVGEGNLEEIDIVQKADNYGWPMMEGMSCVESCKTTGLASPIWQYSHDLGCSVTGGYVVQSAPPSLMGKYVFADFCSGNVWALAFDGVSERLATLLFKNNLQITWFGRALDGTFTWSRGLGGCTK